MENERKFWYATLVRGIVALIAGCAIAFIPDMARTLILLPIAVVVSIFGLALYGVVDSVVILITSYTISWKLQRLALRIQGSIGLVIGLVLLSVVYSRVQLRWFLYFAALQVLATALLEFTVARHASSHTSSVWNYSAAAIALVCGASYWFIAVKYGLYLMPLEISWLIFGYLLAFGVAQCIASIRMLYLRDRNEVPSKATLQDLRRAGLFRT